LLTINAHPGSIAAAFFIKGLTGFGPALIFIPAGALFIALQPIIVASSFLDLVAGLIMWRTLLPASPGYGSWTFHFLLTRPGADSVVL